MTVNVITLGCARNLVDSEHLLFQLKSAGFRVLHDAYDAEADIVIINTCGFILDAKEESIDTILAFLEEKRRGRTGKLLVMGCLSERYREQLESELPEVDGFFGLWDLPGILKATGRGMDPANLTGRIITTPAHYAYLKISEGCNRTCSFCAIPSIRGQQQSVPVENLVEESEKLAGQGVRELILIAQDLTQYGTDLYRRRELPGLLKALVRVRGIEWIRLHYAYPSGFPMEVIELMASEEKICNYLDIPVQHVNDSMLKAMNRGYSRSAMDSLLNQFRLRIPDMALRTTLMTGFPGETEAYFEELKEFVRRHRFDRLGVFSYSHEENTPAFDRYADRVSRQVKRERTEALMQLQQEISLEKNLERVGSSMKVLLDRRENDYIVGRSQYDSPDVDNEILIRDSAGLQTGNFCQVRITGAEAFDLYAEPL